MRMYILKSVLYILTWSETTTALGRPKKTKKPTPKINK